MARLATTGRQKAIARHLRGLAPLMPLADFNAVMAIAIAGHLRHLPPSIAARLGLTAQVRHAHTDYDLLLREGYDRDAARYFVINAMNAVLSDWGGAPIEADETDAEPVDDAFSRQAVQSARDWIR